jgi:hypothetical protein
MQCNITEDFKLVSNWWLLRVRDTAVLEGLFHLKELTVSVAIYINSK